MLSEIFLTGYPSEKRSKNDTRRTSQSMLSKLGNCRFLGYCRNIRRVSFGYQFTSISDNDM